MKKHKSGLWRPFLKFYTRFPIPWYLFIGSVILSVLSSEIYIKVTEITIRVNKGELYNSVIISYALMTVFYALMTGLQNILSAYGSGIMTLRAQRTLWRKILHLPQREVDREEPSNLISAITNDVATSSGCLEVVFGSVSSVYTYIRMWFVLWQFSPDITLYVALTVPFSVGLFFLSGRLQFKQFSKLYSALNTMTSWFSEHLSAAKYVKTQALEDKEIEEGFRAIDERYKADLYNVFMTALQTGLGSAMRRLGTVILAVGGSRLINAGKLEQTAINDASTYSSSIAEHESVMLITYSGIKATQGSLKHVNDLLELPEEKLTEGADMEASSGDIVFRNVNFGYDGQPVLKDTSFTIPYGKVTAMIGGNGSGKSTVLKLLQGFYPIRDGVITLAGQNVAEIKPEQLRSRFAYVLQTMPIFSGTIRENIVYGLKEDVDEATVIRAAKAAGAHEFIMELPEGYQTQTGDDGRNLSGGQRQRIALARALIMQPEYLILDEVTSNLDSKTAHQVLDMAFGREYAPTVIYITHDMEEVKRADHVIVMADGSVEAEGTEQEMYSVSPTYRSFADKQRREAVA